MRKIFLAFVLVIYNLNNPDCHHVNVCNDDQALCVKPGPTGTDDDLLLPISDEDLPLIVEAKILLREEQGMEGIQFTSGDARDFFQQVPEFQAISTQSGQVLSKP